jgi:hypothetical protein
MRCPARPRSGRVHSQAAQRLSPLRGRAAAESTARPLSGRVPCKAAQRPSTVTRTTLPYRIFMKYYTTSSQPQLILILLHFFGTRWRAERAFSPGFSSGGA